MANEHVASTTGRRSRPRGTRGRLAAIAGVATIVLAGCSAHQGYVDGWWDNGDPIYAPLKSTLFDENGVPTCDTPTAFGTFETRARAFTTNGGTINALLFEVTNPETDPSTASKPAARKKLERLQGSLDTIYQLTFPTFDKKYAISSADDMAEIKQDLADHLPGLLTEGQFSDYVKLDTQWIDGPNGYFTVKRANDAEGFITDNKIKTTFNGLANTYYIAQNRDNGDQYLMVTDKNTGESVLMSSGDDFALDSSTELFSKYLVELQVSPPGVKPDASITLVNDQCLPKGGENAARYWVYDYELLDGTEPAPVVLK